MSSETPKHERPRYLLPLAAVTAIGAAIFTFSGMVDREPKPDKIVIEVHEANPLPVPETDPLDDINDLDAGDKITDVPIFRPKPGVSDSESYLSKDDEADDLVMVYEPKLSKIMEEEYRQHLPPKGVKIGLLLSKYPQYGTIEESLVVFNARTKIINGIMPMVSVKPGISSVLPPFASKRELGYDVTSQELQKGSVSGVLLKAIPPLSQDGKPA